MYEPRLETFELFVVTHLLCATRSCLEEVCSLRKIKFFVTGYIKNYC